MELNAEHNYNIQALLRLIPNLMKSKDYGYDCDNTHTYPYDFETKYNINVIVGTIFYNKL